MLKYLHTGWFSVVDLAAMFAFTIKCFKHDTLASTIFRNIKARDKYDKYKNVFGFFQIVYEWWNLNVNY